MITHLAIHFPKPEYSNELLASMHRAGAAAAGKPGLIRIDAWKEINGERLIGLAVWESLEHFHAAREEIFATVDNDPFDLWSEREPDVMVLELD